MATRVSVFVIHDKAVVRAGLSSLIDQQPDLDFVGQSGSISEALEQVQSLRPDVVIVDLRSITAAELDAPATVRSVSPTSFILLLVDNDEGEVFATLAAEADGYCLREADFDKIHAAITSVAAGEFWLDSAIARKVVKALLDTIEIISSDNLELKGEGAEREELSPREVEVLSLVSKGMSNVRIAEQLGISAETVKSHIRHIMKKLVVNDRTQAAVMALKRGLI